MSWRDRDWAKWTDEERRRFYGAGAPVRASGPRSRVGPGSSLFLAVIVSFAVALALGQLPRAHPLIPALHFTFPGTSNTPAAPKMGHISLPASLPLGSFLTLHGQFPHGEAGTVSVQGAYIRPPWRLLAAVPASNGSYEARIRLTHKGLLHLRVTNPDGYRSVGEVRVR